jgi:hypothetical protein
VEKLPYYERKFTPKAVKDRKEASYVKRNRERQTVVPPGKKPWNQKQMSGAAYGEKLGYSLYDSEDYRLHYFQFLTPRKPIF